MEKYESSVIDLKNMLILSKNMLILKMFLTNILNRGQLNRIYL